MTQRLCAPAFSVFAAFAMGFGAPAAQAQTSPVVIELYTSQGCAQCPPAEAWLSRLAVRQDVIALALHVDYWDYLGWADPFARAELTARQRRYARHAGAKMIYTPQVIINGSARLEGSYTAVLDAHIDTALASQNVPGISLTLTRSGETLWIDAEATPPLTTPLEVQMVRYLPYAETLIERGENAGLHAHHHNIVTQWSALAEWSGRARLRLDAPIPGDQPVVVILQEKGPGTIVAAARLADDAQKPAAAPAAAAVSSDAP